MTEYKRLLIQQQTHNGSAFVNVGSVVDTYAQWLVACQEFPFEIYPDTKEVAVKDWHDADGEDAFIPNGGTFMKAYDIEATFIYSGAKSAMRTNIKGFLDFIVGRTGGSSLLAIYDEYTQTGRRGVYVSKVSNDLYYNSNGDDEGIAIFKVTFRVTDPVTEITLSL